MGAGRGSRPAPVRLAAAKTELCPARAGLRRERPGWAVLVVSLFGFLHSSHLLNLPANRGRLLLVTISGGCGQAPRSPCHAGPPGSAGEAPRPPAGAPAASQRTQGCRGHRALRWVSCQATSPFLRLAGPPRPRTRLCPRSSGLETTPGLGPRGPPPLLLDKLPLCCLRICSVNPTRLLNCCGKKGRGTQLQIGK